MEHPAEGNLKDPVNDRPRTHRWGDVSAEGIKLAFVPKKRLQNLHFLVILWSTYQIRVSFV